MTREPGAFVKRQQIGPVTGGPPPPGKPGVSCDKCAAAPPGHEPGCPKGPQDHAAAAISELAGFELRDDLVTFVLELDLDPRDRVATAISAAAGRRLRPDLLNFVGSMVLDQDVLRKSVEVAIRKRLDEVPATLVRSSDEQVKVYRLRKKSKRSKKLR